MKLTAIKYIVVAKKKHLDKVVIKFPFSSQTNVKRSSNGQWNHTVSNTLILLDITYPPVNDGCLGIKKVIGVSSLMGN